MCGNFSLTLPSSLVPSLNQPGHTEKGGRMEGRSVCGVCMYVLGEGGEARWTGNWSYEPNSQLKYRNRKSLKYPGLIHILGKNPLRHLSWDVRILSYGYLSLEAGQNHLIWKGRWRGRQPGGKRKPYLVCNPDYCHPGKRIMSKEAECTCKNSKPHSSTQLPTYSN